MPTVHTVDPDYFWDSAQFHFLSLLVWMFTNSYFWAPPGKKKCRDPKLYIINIWHFLLKLEGSAAESDCFRSALAPAPTLTPAPGVQKAWGIFVHQILNYIHKTRILYCKGKKKKKKRVLIKFFPFFSQPFSGWAGVVIKFRLLNFELKLIINTTVTYNVKNMKKEWKSF